MYHFQLKPEIFEFKTLDEFIDYFNISPNDIIFTEKFLFNNYLKNKVNCRFLFQDDYGLGEPSDIIIDKILKDVRVMEIERIFGIGEERS